MSAADVRFEARMALWGYALPQHADGEPEWNAKVDETWLGVMRDVERGLREDRIERVTIDRGDRGLFVGWVRVPESLR